MKSCSAPAQPLGSSDKDGIVPLSSKIRHDSLGMGQDKPGVVLFATCFTNKPHIYLSSVPDPMIWEEKGFLHS